MIKNYLLKSFFIFLLQGLVIYSCLAGKINFLERSYSSDIAFYNEEGEKVFLDQFEGDTILLVFWATWCAPCHNEMPHLDKLQKDFRKLPFKVIALSEDYQGIKAVKVFYDQQEIRHLKIYHDQKNALFKEFSVVGLPTAFLINKEGKVVVSFNGVIDWFSKEVRNIILTQMPGTPEAPKNSFKEAPLNQVIKSPKTEENKIKEPEENKDKVNE